MNLKEEILAFEYHGSEIGKNYFLNDLENAKQIEMLFDLCQVLRANITSVGWKYLFEEIGIQKLHAIDCKSGWFDTENEKDWIESMYHTAIMNGYNPIDGNIGNWIDNTNVFYSENSKSIIDWNYIHSLHLPISKK